MQIVWSLDSLKNLRSEQWLLDLTGHITKIKLAQSSQIGQLTRTAFVGTNAHRLEVGWRMQPFTSGKAVQVSLESWERKPLYDLFRDISEPFHGVCWRVDCTETFLYAKTSGLSVFLSFVHRALAAAQLIEQFTTRIVEDAVWKYDVIHGGSAVGRPNGTIGFGYYQYAPGLQQFAIEAAKEVERVKQRTDIERYTQQDLIRFSVLPWFDFTSISHARDFGWRDSAPKITFGKITERDGRHTMPVSIHVHHALADGLHVARFAELFERNLAIPDQAAPSADLF